MKDIIYITSFNSLYSGRVLDYSLAECTCSSYIISSLKKEGFHVSVFSTGTGRNNSYLSRRKVDIDENECQYYFPSFKTPKSYLLRIINQFIIYFSIIINLVYKTRGNVEVLIYHNNLLSYIYPLIARISKRRVSFVVGELYSAVYSLGIKKINKEKQRLALGNKYIFANDIMGSLFDKKGDSIVCYGATHYLDSYNKKDIENKINVVYAGKIEKGAISDAFMAVEVARFLSSNYKVHIIGYGSKNDLEDIKQKIQAINNDIGFEIVSYDGCLLNNELDSFLSQCQIGLCTRLLDENASNYCFPSKTLVYMCHGVIPVCPDLRVLSDSKVAPGILFIKGLLTPNKVARIIMENKDKTFNYKELLDKIDSDFRAGLKKLFN